MERFNARTVFFESVGLIMNLNDCVMEATIDGAAMREPTCEELFMNCNAFWHLCTSGVEQVNIFLDADDYRKGITAIALALMDAREMGLKVKVYAFALMSNHLHELLEGPEADCREFFKCQKRRIARFVSHRVSLANFDCKLIPVNNLNSFQNEVCYIHRNGYLVHSGEVPYSYEWSTGLHYFNRHMRKIPSRRFADLTFREKRELTKSVVSDKYDELALVDGYISPLSFCEIQAGERMFKSAHQYFHKLSRNYEAFSLIAKTLGEDVFLSDEDMFSVLCSRAKAMFNQTSPRNLTPDQRLEMAKLLHKEYNASNAQLKRMLALSPDIIQELFPKVR